MIVIKRQLPTPPIQEDIATFKASYENSTLKLTIEAENYQDSEEFDITGWIDNSYPYDLDTWGYEYILNSISGEMVHAECIVEGFKYRFYVWQHLDNNQKQAIVSHWKIIPAIND